MPTVKTQLAYDRITLANVEELVEDAQAAADSAQAAADAAQDAVDAIEVPPNGIQDVSSNTVLTPSDVLALVDASGGAVTISLSNASGYAVPVVITKVDGTGNAVNVVPTGGDTLNGGAGPVAITTPQAPRTFVADQVSQWLG